MESCIKIIMYGDIAEFSLNSDGKTILDAAEEVGMFIPYTCMSGSCVDCKGKIIKGSANMDMNYALTDDEISGGFILTCQAHPTSLELIISFDEE